MRISSSEAEPSNSPPLNRRRPHHRRRLPPSSPTSASVSSHPQTHESNSAANDSPASDAETQLDSYSEDLPNDSFASSYAATPAYIPVVPLPIFRGEPGECPDAHLTRFERVCRANNASTVDAVIRIFPVTLDGEAALWYDLAVEPHPSMSWDHIKSAFIRAFRRPEFADGARAELFSLRQRDGESVTSYHLRLQWILKRWPDHGLPESLLRGLFVDGLREELHDWVGPQRPETLEEALSLAMDWEAAQGARAARRREAAVALEAKCGFCEGGHEEKDCEARREMREEWMRRKRGGEKKSGDEAREEEDERLGRLGSIGRRSQCQCWKHQCWRKIERSSSAVARTSDPAATAGGAGAGASAASAVAGSSMVE
ncbi:hypothetical protein AXF42_Ash007197 [Apostasia shenzhenica]|uniref:Retrotransposon gag domain-containing protein n=1 Tax=Apostasia shenzhenica TaxID=1088818 RepID=A0A2I0B9I9_9ASPA|nr:hypothetical protein AXF42_Ash007197 [Apostasia shenzhenica]